MPNFEEIKNKIVVWEKLSETKFIVSSESQLMPFMVDCIWWGSNRFYVQKQIKKFLLGLKIYKTRHSAHKAVLASARLFKRYPENKKLIDYNGQFYDG